MARQRDSYFEFPAYVPVAERRKRAQKELAKSGKSASPIVIEGKKIVQTFWGTSWCQNLEAYSDYANRLPRGRTYVRNGSVVDLSVAGGTVHARVSGSSLYQVKIEIRALPADRWTAIKSECGGGIDSLVELLAGRFSDAVMTVMTRRPGGLFPTPTEISLDCSCPDAARMCKHVAATLYGVGARLDAKPELLFELRGLDPIELVSAAGAIASIAGKTATTALAGADLSSIFGIEIEDDPVTIELAPAPKKKAIARKKPTPKKPAARKKPAPTKKRKLTR